MASTNIPIQLTTFIGRTSDLAEVERLLSEARLVTLTGTGGCGKTRLAVQVANQVSGLFEDGVWWVDLAALRDPAFVPQLVVHTFGLHPVVDQPILESLIGFVGPKQLLLILDNCEHLNEASAQLTRQLLIEAPRLRILATSREPLAIAGESIYPVSGLAWPFNPVGLDDNPQDLIQYDAVKLFVERAWSISPGFKLTIENAPTIVEICRRLDGLPLALELASARVNILTVQEIAIRLNDCLNLLTFGKRTGFVSRHSTLRAAIDWSYDLLTAEEQILLSRLAVFADGCTLDLVEAVCLGEGVDAGYPLDLLSSLVDKSLILAETTGRAQARYRLLETIREYALEKLDRAGEASRLRDRHLELFLTRAEEALPKQFESYQQLWLNWLESEHDNLRAALSWALESKQIETGLRLANALALFWEIHGYIQEGVGWMERLLAAADESTSLDVHVNALVFTTFHYMALGNSQAATTCARKAVELAEAASDENNPILAFAMDGLASAAKAAGDFQTAFDITEKNILLYRKSGPSFYLGMSLLAQGEMAFQLEYFDVARERLDESLMLARQDGDAFRTAHTYNNLGDLDRLEQNYTEAITAYENGAALMRQLGADRDLASILSNLGFAHLHLGEVELAYRFFAESLAIHQGQHNRDGITDCLIGFGGTAVRSGQPAAGVCLLSAAAAHSGQPSASKWKPNQMEFERYLGEARGILANASFQEEQAAGRTLSLEQAVECARQLQIQPGIPPRNGDTLGDLTQREREVAALIGRGKTNSQIALELVLSKRTVEKHAGNILSKLGLTSRAQIVRWAIEKGLVQATE